MTSPFGRLVLIANPRAGRGRVGARLPEVEQTLRAGGLQFRVVHTRGPRHATYATRDALEAGHRFIVAVGGDGTVHEVVNGMIEDDAPVAADAVLGVIAAGSGCDFVRTFGLPGDVARAAARLAGEEVRPLDVGKVTCRDPEGGEVVRYFPNVAEAGLGASVAARASGLPPALGPARYFAAFWMVLPRFRPARVRLTADGRSFEGRAHNVVVANCCFYGGGMRISPRSEPDDGLLDVLVMVGPKREAFTILPRVYRGSHLPHRHIAELRARRVEVEAEAPFRVEADGELLGTTPARFEVLDRPLRLKV